VEELDITGGASEQVVRLFFRGDKPRVREQRGERAGVLY